MRLRRRLFDALLIAALLTNSGLAPAKTYTTTLTGVLASDQASGYPATADNGSVRYAFGAADGIALEANSGDVYGVDTTAANGSLPIILDSPNGAGTLSFSAHRDAVGSSGVGEAMSVTGAGVTVNGNSTYYAQSDDAVPNSTSLGLRIYQAPATFNGSVNITTYTPGYSQALWVYQGKVNINGPTTILAQARGSTTCGIYNSGGGVSVVNLNGNLAVSALAIWPSDNVHGIYNDNQNSVLNVGGGVTLKAVSQGSTVFGLRNQGVYSVANDSTYDVEGPRTTAGLANTHHSARMSFHGNVALTVVNGTNYTPFGLPVAIWGFYTGAGYAHFYKGVQASVTATTTAYGIETGTEIDFLSPTDTVSIAVSSSCSGCNVYAVSNVGGSVLMSGGARLTPTPPSGGVAYAIQNLPTASADATVSINVGAAMPVQMQGIVATGSVGSGATERLAHTTLNLDTPDSFIAGPVTGYSDSSTAYSVGAPTITLSKRATWKPGMGSTINDLGAGTLSISGGATVDLSGQARAASTLDSTRTGGASVTLGPGATLRIDSNIRAIGGAQAASAWMLGAGITALHTADPLQLAVADDPLFTSGQISDVLAWTTYSASPALVVVDATASADATAQFVAPIAMVRKVAVTIGGSARQALVRPVLTLSSNKRQILLAGIDVSVLPTDEIFQTGFDYAVDAGAAVVD